MWMESRPDYRLGKDTQLIIKVMKFSRFRPNIIKSGSIGSLHRTKKSSFYSQITLHFNNFFFL